MASWPAAAKWNAEVDARLRADHRGPTHGYHLDVSFGETLTRHANLGVHVGEQLVPQMPFVRLHLERVVLLVLVALLL